MLLRAWGYDVEVAHTGREAIERAIAFNPRVILLDIGLPDLSGYEVARQLRGDQRTQAAHLVALTGFGQESDFQHSREAGFDLHLVKPVDSAVLQRLLANVQASQPET